MVEVLIVQEKVMGVIVIEVVLLMLGKIVKVK